MLASELYGTHCAQVRTEEVQRLPRLQAACLLGRLYAAQLHAAGPPMHQVVNAVWGFSMQSMQPLVSMNRTPWPSCALLTPGLARPPWLTRPPPLAVYRCRPEICRTYNFGDIGSSSGQYFRLFLKPIRLNNRETTLPPSTPLLYGPHTAGSSTVQLP